MNFSATIPVADMEAANAFLNDAAANGVADFGPANFSVPVRAGTQNATHAGLHCWNNPDLEAVVRTIANAVVTGSATDGAVNFAEHCQAETLEWSDSANWHENPVMKGDQRTIGGKTWESLIDYNVWEPGVSGWREVVAQGYPEFVQPTGAHDAYAIGERVTFEGADYESLIDANVWSPSTYPAGWQVL